MVRLPRSADGFTFARFTVGFCARTMLESKSATGKGAVGVSIYSSFRSTSSRCGSGVVPPCGTVQLYSQFRAAVARAVD